jgi:hypothetical protein
MSGVGTAGSGVTFVGVRHHSPACARLVEATVTALRPAYVLVEGPADLNGRIEELLLGHELPVAIFSSYRDPERTHGSWAPFCEYSPEYVAFTAGRAVGARLRFIDLPAWHPAFAHRTNRYADAEQRYATVVERLCAEFSVDNVDSLWDHLIEIDGSDGLADRLAAYFDLVRGDGAAGDDDTAREAYMARWIRAAAADAGGRPVVVVTGGFHRPALMRLVRDLEGTGNSWPDVPRPPADAVGGSYLVPYSFRRLDAFDGYQSGMPSPAYYQDLWDHGPQAAADRLTGAVVARLRARRQHVSTASLIAARATASGLAMVRGHRYPARTDVLDGLAATLVGEALDVPLPWSSRGTLRAGSHPVVVEMVAALSGDRVGRLHPDTPLPPLVHDVEAELERHHLDGARTVDLDLTTGPGRAASRVLHRLRVLRIPGVRRESGPTTGADPVFEERWTLTPVTERLPALIEAGAYGGTLDAAATALIEERAEASDDVEVLAGALFDAALCGIGTVSDRILRRIDASVGAAPHLGPLGAVLTVTLMLWRHDRLLGTARSPAFGRVIGAAVRRVLWLAEGLHGGPAPADPARLNALVATRDAVVHAGDAVGADRGPALDVMARIAVDRTAPPDLRGAAFGFTWSLGAPAGDAATAVRSAALPDTVGDWLAGLFALAREEVLHADGVITLLDDLVDGMPEHDFLVALPALRQAFSWFPPREREVIAGLVLTRRGHRGTARAFLRQTVDPDTLLRARTLEHRVDTVLAREGLA